MRIALVFGLLLLGSCATRAVPDQVPRHSPLSSEAQPAPLAAPAIALAEEPPLPDEPTSSPLWSTLDDHDAAVFPLPSEPGEQWSTTPAAQPPAGHDPHGGHHHGAH